jgi:hypothetical protein
MSVEAAPGQVAVPAANGTGSLFCPWDAPEVVNLAPSPPAGTNRIDLIVCQSHGQDVDGGAVDDFVITAVDGSAGQGATPTPPAVPAGAVALAQVHVTGGAASIAAGDITDTRPSGLAVPAAATLALAPMRHYFPLIATDPGGWHGQGTHVFTQALPAIAGGYHIHWAMQIFAHLVAGTFLFAGMGVVIDGENQADQYEPLASASKSYAHLFLSGVKEITDGRPVTVFGNYGGAPGFGGDGQVGYQPGGTSNYLRIDTLPLRLRAW